MRMSDGVEWALHVAAVLAVVPPGHGMTAAKLAEYHGVPGAYLAKHLQALTRAGVFEAVPGRGGGYRLARPAGEVSVLDVVEAVEGRTRAFECSEIRQRGPAAGAKSDYRNVCGIARVMYDAEAAYREELRKVTIADLLNSFLRSAAPAAQVRAAKWMQRELSS
ncbi:MAG TPA: Rrf2 family transcriptional regulator [Acidimicrobiales bacterium]|nr:Rrf2 family transcriptional regulator [Acidimicrobiales bacterium]